MRRTLDALYAGALGLACLAMAAIAALVLAQIAGRVIDLGADLIGAPRLGLAVPSLAEFGGFLFVAAVFLALPATLRAGGHVRVTLALRFLGERGRRAATALVLAVGLGLAAFASWHVALQTAASFARGSVSYGLVPIPLWIPQTAMAAGLLIFALALLDELAATLRGEAPAFRRAEESREIEGGH